jgi:uncharacterized protein YjiS (DUF1127 family)
MERPMTTCVPNTLTNHHDHTSFAGVFETLRIWRARSAQRRELAHFTERDLHDVGLSWDDVALEIQKPFWRS